MGSHSRIQTLLTPNVDSVVCHGHVCGLISPEGDIFPGELILKLVVQTLLSVLRQVPLR